MKLIATRNSHYSLILSRDSNGAVHEPDRAITVAAQKARGRLPTGLQDAILPHIP